MRLTDWWRTSDSTLARWLRAAHDALLGEMPILAAGTALYAIIAAVPTLAAVVAVFGLVTDAHQIQDHLKGLETVLPQEVVDFLGDQLARQAARGSGELGLQLASSLVLALISARSSVRALVDALNRAYRVRDTRGTLHKLGLTFALAAGTLVALTIVFAVVVALPAIVAMIGLKGMGVVRWARWPVLLAMTYATLLALYRVAPSPRPLGADRKMWPGAAISTLLLVLVSWGLSQWVERVANYEVFYGAFGSIIVVVLWFYLATIALVIGGFVNAELERAAGAPAPDRSMY